MSIGMELTQKAAQLGKHVVRMTASAGSGHPSSALSLAHLVTYLLYRHMRHDPRNPWHPTADRLVLSEGHAVPIIYAAWADLNGAVGRDADKPIALTPTDLETSFRTHTGVLDGHPNPAEGFPFFDAATGSLGMGLSVAAGLALAARLDGSERRIYVLIGDGESREGQIWEALDFVADHRLTHVCPIFNCNGQGQAGYVSPQQAPERLAAKLRGFGYEVTEIDGHSPADVERAFVQFEQHVHAAAASAGADGAGATTVRPVAVVARTIKGWGVDTLQKGNWHGKPLKELDLDAAFESLDRAAAGHATAELGRPPAPVPAKPPVLARPDPREVRWPSFEEAMRSAGLGAGLDKRALATRQAYGAALKIAGDLLPQVVALDGDVSNSTFSQIFGKAHPARFFECKIAEQNMLSTAAGLAAGGYIPFVNSFAKFITRAYDQVELASISRANIKLVGSHAGVTPAADGPSQMALSDLAYFRSFTTVRADDRESPLCWVYQPADAVAAYHCTRLMVQHRGMCYMRTHRPSAPLMYEPETVFEPGGFQVLGSGGDVAIVTAGYLVYVGRHVLETLAKQRIRATLIDAYSLPLQAERLTEVLRRAGGRVLVVEDNYGAGLGAAVAEIAARSCSGNGGIEVQTLNVQRIPKSARTEAEILAYTGVGAGEIADRVMAVLRRPR